MKDKKVCPKCGCEEIIVVEGTASNFGSNNHIKVGMTIYSAIMVDRYVCCGCGYSEEWINKKDIRALKDYVK